MLCRATSEIDLRIVVGTVSAHLFGLAESCLQTAEKLLYHIFDWHLGALRRGGPGHDTETERDRNLSSQTVKLTVEDPRPQGQGPALRLVEVGMRDNENEVRSIDVNELLLLLDILVQKLRHRFDDRITSGAPELRIVFAEFVRSHHDAPQRFTFSVGFADSLWEPRRREIHFVWQPGQRIRPGNAHPAAITRFEFLVFVFEASYFGLQLRDEVFICHSCCHFPQALANLSAIRILTQLRRTHTVKHI